MRTVIILLVLANLTFLGYALLDIAPEGEAARLSQQVDPQKIKLLTPAEVAALAPATPSLTDVCLEWGPLGDAERAKALTDLDPLNLGKLLSQKRVEVTTSFVILLPPLASRAEAEKRAAELKGQGLNGTSVIDSGNQRFVVSLGAYPSEEAANARLAELAKQGVANAKVTARQQVLPETSFVIHDPQPNVVAKVRELVTTYPGTEAKVGGCDKA
jgi:hypothetical protein